MISNHVDPFALAGLPEAEHAAGDAEILLLFRGWLDESRLADRLCRGETRDAAAYDAAVDRQDEIEGRILATRAGAVGVAVKAYFLLRLQFSNWAPQDATFRCPELFAGDVHELGQDATLCSMLRDAAAIVPDLADLVAPVIHEDAALIDAEIDIGWCRDRLADPDVDRLGQRDEIKRLLSTMLDRVAKTEAKTATGVAVKSRHRACGR
jgi:hypothetical protein